MHAHNLGDGFMSDYCGLASFCCRIKFYNVLSSVALVVQLVRLQATITWPARSKVQQFGMEKLSQLLPQVTI